MAAAPSLLPWITSCPKIGLIMVSTKPGEVHPWHDGRGAVAKIEPYLLNLAGEYRVCSELCKRGIFATVTYGNRKGVDVYAISDRQQRAVKIEVKTSQRGNFVTGISQKGLANDPTAPDFWVLFQLRAGAEASFAERFFVLSHPEICSIQAARNKLYGDKYEVKHGRQPDFSTGVDNVPVADVEQHENQWSKIPARFDRPSSSHCAKGLAHELYHEVYQSYNHPATGFTPLDRECSGL